MMETTTNSSLIKINLDNVKELGIISKERNTSYNYNDDYSSIEISSSINTRNRHYGRDSKSYECQVDECRKSFKDKGAYRKHQLTHGEKLVINFSKHYYSYITTIVSLQKLWQEVFR